MRSTRSATRIGFTPAQTRRVFDAARGAAACRSSCTPSSSATRAAPRWPREFGALSCDHLEHLSDDGVARDGARPARWRCCCPARSTSCARRKLPPVAALRDAGVPMAIATDHNPGSSPTLSLLLMLNMACTLFRLTPEEALRGVTVHARARARPAADRRHARGRQARRLRGVGRSSTRTSWPTGSAATRAGASSRGGQERNDDAIERATSSRCTAARAPLLVSLPHVGTRIPDDQRTATSSARSPSKTPTGTSTALYAFVRELGASLLVPRIQPLRHRPEPAARKHADVPRRQQHRAVPDALLHRRAAVPRGQAPDDSRDRAPRRALLAPYHDALQRRAAAPARRARPRRAVRRPQHQVASCRGCSKAACPTSTSARAGGTSCAPTLRERSPPCSRRSSASRTWSTAASRAATSRATTAGPHDGVHAVQLEMCWRCYMDEKPPYELDARAHGARAAAAARAGADDARLDGRVTTDAPSRCWAPHAWLHGGWRERVLLEVGADGRWADVTPGVRRRRPTPTVLAGPALPGLVERAQPCVPARLRRPGRAARAASTTTSGLARPHVRRGAAHHARRSCAPSRRSCTSSCCAAATRRCASSTTCSTTRDGRALCRPAGDAPGRWPTPPPTPASA